ncbi:hypothetical protein VFES401_11305 [Aliivibrio fischeri]|uniref:F4 family fimbrial subunit n=1 Tax=Aliivibrio fischeri TaxID=668 RepID=UPI0007C47E79|nr:hypothetical protein [Aliivibrio fischeri]TGA70297.1 hypothetical protein VFES401_11305 [Aliivibrio fischeri]
MKKSLLALTVLSTMTIAGAANAAFTYDKLGQFNGTVDFKGRFITAKTSTWAWQISDALKLFAAHQDITKKHGKANGSDTTFDVSKPGVTYTFLEGYMVGTSAGGTGISPKVMINGTEVAPGNQSAVFVKANGDNGASGLKLTFDLDTALSVAKKDASNAVSWVHDDGLTTTNAVDLGNKALNVLKDNNLKIDADFPSLPATGTQVDALSLLSTAGTDILAGGWYTQISNIQLTGPTAEIDSYTTWSATIPVVVTQN